MQKPYKPGQAVPTFPRCPVYRGSDNIAHLLGECAHPIMKGLSIERHNAAGRMIYASQGTTPGVPVTLWLTLARNTR